jgi:adenylate cyclase
MDSRRRNRLTIIALLSVLSAIVHACLFSWFGGRVETNLVDAWFSLRGSRSVPTDVVVVAMDEQSYSGLGIQFSSAWPRELHARLLRRLREYGAKKVVFDILFLGAGASPKADDDLAAALREIPSILGMELTKRIVALPGGSVELEELEEPYDPFLKHASAALVGLPEDHGIVRRFLIDRTDQSRAVPSLAEAGAGVTANSQGVGRDDIINYYGTARTVPTHSYVNVVQDEHPLPAGLFRDKIVYVGLSLRTESGPAQKDLFGSPFYGEKIFGVEIHAAAAANLIDRSWIRRLGSSAELGLLSLLALVLSAIIIYLNPLTGSAVLLGAVLIWAVGSFFAFTRYLFIPGVLLFIIQLPILFLLSTVYYYAVIRRSQQRIVNAFSHYLAPEMAQRMVENSKALTLGGEKLWCTALFTDIAGFTDITETMPAERVSEMLNAYFSEVMEAIFVNQGTVIKFIGDSVFALWGAPIRVDNHAELAIRSALSIQQEVSRFNASKRFPELKTRIGISTGPMLVGNLGCAKRLDYTALGDSVNVASRIEGLNRHFGTSILLSESTKKELGERVPHIFVGKVKVAGKKEAIALYSLIEHELTDSTEEKWNSALSLFRQRQWYLADEAFIALEQATEIVSKLATFYRSEILEYRKNEPVMEWQGELVFARK